MRLRISQRAKLYRVSYYGRTGSVSTFCLARNESEARNTVSKEYSYEYKEIGVRPEQMSVCPCPETNSWDSKENIMRTGRSVIIATSLFI